MEIRYVTFPTIRLHKKLRELGTRTTESLISTLAPQRRKVFWEKEAWAPVLAMSPAPRVGLSKLLSLSLL